MAKKRAAVAAQPAEQPAEQPDVLAEAQAEIAEYGDQEVSDMIKSANDQAEDLSKASRQQPPSGGDDKDSDGDGDDDEQEDDDDEESADEENDDEKEGDDDDSDDSDGGGFVNAETPAKTKGGKKSPMRRSQSSDASERFLKSVLLDEQGEPRAEAEVIEVSDVLVHLTDTMAKAIGEMAEQIGSMQHQLDQVILLQKALGNHQLQTGRIVKSMQATRERQPASKPHPGITHSMSKSMPGVAPKGEAKLTKSQAAAGLLVAFQQSQISADQYKRLAPMLDTQGPDAVMAQLPEAVSKEIYTAIEKLNGKPAA